MKHIESTLISAIAALAPTKAMLLTVLVLCLLDMALGIIAAFRRKEKITSKGLKRTVLKLCVYETAIVCAYLAQTYLLGPEIPAMSLVSGLVGVTELKSVLENLDDINGSPIFKIILSKLEAPNEAKSEVPGPDKKV